MDTTYPYDDVEKVNKLPTPQEYSDTLAQNPKLKAAKDEALNMPDTSKIDTPEREELRRNIEAKQYQALLDKYQPDKDKTMNIVIGPPGAGKTSVVDPKLAHAMVIESDDVKVLLPEYNKGIGATSLRTEINKKNDKMIERAMKEGQNII